MATKKKKKDAFGNIIPSNILLEDIEKEKKKEITPPTPIEDKDSRVFTSSETGETSGVTINGKTYLGLKPKDVEKMLKGERAKREKFPETQAVQEESRIREIEAEKEKTLTEETPGRVELDPSRTALETTPIIGGFVSAGIATRRLINKKIKKLFGKDISDVGIGIGDISQLPPEEARDLEISAIQREETEKGLTFNEALGAYVEALPTGDSVLGVSFAKTLEKPSENAAEVATNIRKIKRQISNVETNVRMGYLPVETAQTQIDDMELNVYKLEARLNMFINNSPSLKFNSDLVNIYETDILAIRQKMLQAKLNILEGKINDPTEMDLYLKTKAQEDADLTAFEAGSA